MGVVSAILEKQQQSLERALVRFTDDFVCRNNRGFGLPQLFAAHLNELLDDHQRNNTERIYWRTMGHWGEVVVSAIFRGCKGMEANLWGGTV